MLFRTCFPFPYSPAYIGHYIVLCGYNLHSRKFMYRNPVMKDRKLEALRFIWVSLGSKRSVMFQMFA